MKFIITIKDGEWEAGKRELEYPTHYGFLKSDSDEETMRRMVEYFDIATEEVRKV